MSKYADKTSLLPTGLAGSDDAPRAAGGDNLLYLDICSHLSDW